MLRTVLRVCAALPLMLALGCGGGSASPAAPTQPATQEPSTPVAPPPIVFHDSLNADPASAAQAMGFSFGTAPGFGTQVLDDFVSLTSGGAKHLAWQGIACDTHPVGAVTPTGLVPRFYIALHANRGLFGGQFFPEFTPSWSRTYAPEEVVQTFVAAKTALCGGNGTAPGALYRYSVDLPTPLQIEAGTRYWLSLQFLTSQSQLSWGWQRSETQDNGYGYYTTHAVWLPFDLAFSLRD